MNRSLIFFAADMVFKWNEERMRDRERGKANERDRKNDLVHTRWFIKVTKFYVLMHIYVLSVGNFALSNTVSSTTLPRASF